MGLSDAVKARDAIRRQRHMRIPSEARLAKCLGRRMSAGHDLDTIFASDFGVRHIGPRPCAPWEDFRCVRCFAVVLWLHLQPQA
jgi:hypothetical protein